MEEKTHLIKIKGPQAEEFILFKNRKKQSEVWQAAEQFIQRWYPEHVLQDVFNLGERQGEHINCYGKKSNTRIKTSLLEHLGIDMSEEKWREEKQMEETWEA